VKVEFDKLMPGPTDRALFVGQTGCGKTTLAQRMLNSIHGRRIMVFDLKRDLLWPGWKRFRHLAEVIAAVKKGEMRIIYAPADKEFDSPEYYDAFFKLCFRLGGHGGCIVYIDEVTLCTNGAHMPRYYKACVQQGRGLGVSVWTATQRPSGIPKNLRTETENFYLFYLQDDKDRDVVEGLTKLGDELQDLPDHHFFYKRRRETLGPIQFNI
jgi:GTPase SAR1 family protein